MRLYELAYTCRPYTSFIEFDLSLKILSRLAGSALDLNNKEHKKALFVWLNYLGCRQFAKEYHSLAVNALEDWIQCCRNQLPSEVTTLDKLSDSAIDAAANAYGDLKDRKASLRHRNSREHAVTFGPKGAAKVLYALQPNTLPPLDDPIREHFGYDGSPVSYGQFLAMGKKEISCLVEEASSLGLLMNDIPKAIGQPEVTLPKIIDEYYWITITSECMTPSEEEITQWAAWARGR